MTPDGWGIEFKTVSPDMVAGIYDDDGRGSLLIVSSCLVGAVILLGCLIWAALWLAN
jgi:hypothetical protein